ncbi:hypothetical protein MMC25_000964 [Agyrium rufum]|nr:hypothetical protein [Agyrium rufum]
MLRAPLRRRTRKLLARAICLFAFVYILADVLSISLHPKHAVRRRPPVTNDSYIEELPTLFISIFRRDNHDYSSFFTQAESRPKSEDEENAAVAQEFRSALTALVEKIGVNRTFVHLLERTYDTKVPWAGQREGQIGLLGLDLERMGAKYDVQRVAPWLWKGAEEAGMARVDFDSMGGGDLEIAMRASWMRWEIGARNSVFDGMRKKALQGERWERILFLDEVLFTPEDVTTLLTTQNGTFAGSCALPSTSSHSTSKPILLSNQHNPLEILDSSSQPLLSATTYPYFASFPSRQALIAGKPIPVQSCFGPMAVFPTEKIYSTQSSKALHFPDPPPDLAAPPSSVLFDPKCLFAKKMQIVRNDTWLLPTQKPNRDLEKMRKMWINPKVRVAKDLRSWSQVRAGIDVEGKERVWPGRWERSWGLVRNWMGRWAKRLGMGGGDGGREVARRKFGEWTANTRKSVDYHSMETEVKNAHWEDCVFGL